MKKRKNRDSQRCQHKLSEEEDESLFLLLLAFVTLGNQLASHYVIMTCGHRKRLTTITCWPRHRLTKITAVVGAGAGFRIFYFDEILSQTGLRVESTSNANVDQGTRGCARPSCNHLHPKCPPQAPAT